MILIVKHFISFKRKRKIVKNIKVNIIFIVFLITKNLKYTLYKHIFFNRYTNKSVNLVLNSFNFLVSCFLVALVFINIWQIKEHHQHACYLSKICSSYLPHSFFVHSVKIR